MALPRVFQMKYCFSQFNKLNSILVSFQRRLGEVVLRAFSSPRCLVEVEPQHGTPKLRLIRFWARDVNGYGPYCGAGVWLKSASSVTQVKFAAMLVEPVPLYFATFG